jgi:hypothetical protein
MIHLFNVSSSSKEKQTGAVVVAAKELIGVASDPFKIPVDIIVTTSGRECAHLVSRSRWIDMY